MFLLTTVESNALENQRSRRTLIRTMIRHHDSLVRAVYCLHFSTHPKVVKTVINIHLFICITLVRFLTTNTTLLLNRWKLAMWKGGMSINSRSISLPFGWQVPGWCLKKLPDIRHASTDPTAPSQTNMSCLSKQDQEAFRQETGQ